MRYIDMHCDTLARCVDKPDITDIYDHPDRQVDIKKLVSSGAGAQCFAAFIPQQSDDTWQGLDTPEEHMAKFERMRTLLLNSIDAHSDEIAFAKNIKDIRANKEAGKVSAMLTIENGFLIDGKLDNLRKVKRDGASIIALTWNSPNCFGQCNSKNPVLMSIGLTDFGKEAIEYMNAIGLIVDVSHLSDGGFYDVARISKKPFVATHSNCRSLCGHQRNLTDDMIKILADHGGVTGINFFHAFINSDLDDTHTTVEGMAKHIDHLVNIGGEDCIGIGTDFDGISGTVEISDTSMMNMFFDKLIKMGYSENFVEKIAFRNVERVFEECL